MRWVIAFLLVGTTVKAQEPSFEALGQVSVVGGDHVRARDRALDEALRQAVEQAVSTVLEPSQLVARSSELRLRIYPKARTYIENYRILDEGETSGVFQVHVSAQVATGRLARDLAAPAPSIAPTSSKKLRGVVCARGAVERVARETLVARGIDLVPAPPNCNEAMAAQTAQAAAGQGALVGNDEITPEGAIRGTDQVAARAKVTLKLVEPSGRVSADGSGDKMAYGPSQDAANNEAARAAATEAARALQPALSARFPAPGESVSGSVLIHVSGLQRYADYSALLRALSSLPGVAGAEPRRFARGEVDLAVRTASSASQLASALERAPSGVRVTTSQVGDGLDVRIAATPPADGAN